MEVKELRLGNLIDIIDKTREWHLPIGGVFEVSKISQFRVEVGGLKINDVPPFDIDSIDIAPIPLTEEWLLKFGFIISYESEFRKKLGFKENTQFGYDFNKIGKENGMHGFRYYGRYHNCEFVHQLQNLYFALTGEELSIKQTIEKTF